MSFTNTPLMTCTQLLAHVQAIVGDDDDTVVGRAVEQAVVGFGTNFMSTFYIEFVIQTVPEVEVTPAVHHYPYCCCRGGVCEIVMGTYGIDKILNVERSCGNGCWTPVNWWRTQDNRLILDGKQWVGSVRITYQEAPAFLPTVGSMYADWSWGDPEVHVSATGITPTLHIPTSGYVRIGTDPAYWIEYRGMNTEAAVGAVGIHLLGVQTAPYAQAGTPVVEILEDTQVLWGIAFPSAGQLDAVMKQSAAYYWATKTGSCINEEDRSTATQLMNFWTGEAENAWKRALSQRPRKAILMRSPVLLRGATPWQYQ
jgi:hypothetical protein